MRRPARLILIIWFAVLLAIPGLASPFVSRETIGNRPVVEAPEVAGRTVWNGEYFSQMDGYIEDRLSIRERSIEANAAIAYEVFGDSANPAVLIGKDDILFLSGTFEIPCTAQAEGRWPDGPSVRIQLDSLDGLLQERGAELAYMVVPEKGWVHPDMLPGAVPGLACARPLLADLRTSIEGHESYVDLFGYLVRRGSKAPDLLYQRTDTHWNHFGRTVAVEYIVDSFQPGLYDRSTIVEDEIRNGPGGDLAKFIGYEIGESDTPLRTVRPEVSTTTVERPGREKRWQSEGPPGSLIPGRTLVVTDSHLDTSAGSLAAWFEDLTVVRFQDLSEERTPADLVEADRVILSFTGRFGAERLRSISRVLNEMLATS